MSDDLHIYGISDDPGTLEFVGQEEARQLGVEQEPEESSDVCQEISRRVLDWEPQLDESE